MSTIFPKILGRIASFAVNRPRGKRSNSRCLNSAIAYLAKPREGRSPFPPLLRWQGTADATDTSLLKVRRDRRFYARLRPTTAGVQRRPRVLRIMRSIGETSSSGLENHLKLSEGMKSVEKLKGSCKFLHLILCTPAGTHTITHPRLALDILRTLSDIKFFPQLSY